MTLHPLDSQLRTIEEQAQHLPWADQRLWRCATHLGWDAGLPMVDLHGLSVRLALKAVESILDAAPPQGGVVLITGRGKHTGGRSALREAVKGVLAREQVRVISRGPGRLEVVFDEEAVSGSRPGLGCLFWLMVLLFGAGIFAVFWNRL